LTTLVRQPPSPAQIHRYAHCACILAGDTGRVLGQIIGRHEPQRLIDDKPVCVGAGAGVIVERRRRDAIARGAAGSVCALHECSSNFTSTDAPLTMQKPRCVPGVAS
jgi:hypothetical protein